MPAASCWRRLQTNTACAHAIRSSLHAAHSKVRWPMRCFRKHQLRRLARMRCSPNSASNPSLFHNKSTLTPFMPGPLSHIRVLDLTRVLAGPWASQNLADLGAEVIKVERPGTGDDVRDWGPPFLKDRDGKDTHESAYYLSVNRGKKSLTLDIAKPEGAAIARELAAKSDVLIENYKVGGLKKYGLAYDDVRTINPKIVYCSITGFGQDGPLAHRPGYDFVFQGMGGLMSITGERDDLPGGGPQKVGIAITDVLTGMYASLAITAAIAHRERTGRGQYIDMALLDTIVAFGANQIFNWFMSGDVPRRWGNAHPNLLP